MLMLSAAIVKYHNQSVVQIPVEYRNFIIIRSFLGFAGMSAIWVGIKFMPVGITICISSMGNILGPLWGRIFLKEKLTKIDILALFSAFFGVILINDPLG